MKGCGLVSGVFSSDLSAGRWLGADGRAGWDALVAYIAQHGAEAVVLEGADGLVARKVEDLGDVRRARPDGNSDCAARCNVGTRVGRQVGNDVLVDVGVHTAYGHGQSELRQGSAGLVERPPAQLGHGYDTGC